VRDTRVRLRREGFRPEVAARSFALVREAAARSIGERHYDVQIAGGWVLLRGMVAEMETGEGKTLTATLAAGTAGLAGIPTHVVTVNDYLAARDAAWMGPVYAALGISVGVIQQGMTLEERRAAYECDVTYCSNKEVAFDYLKDRIVLGRNATRVRLISERLFGGPSRSDRVILRGLCYGIVDEADSVLIDEARTPLIISNRTDVSQERELYEAALGMARRLALHEEFEIDERDHSIRITDPGRARLEELCAPLGGIWTGSQRREDLVRQALTAVHVLKRDADYLVKDGRVQIIDEYTGRLMADRAWEHGVHQLVEVKEGVDLTGRQEPRARISYQRFFRRYLRLAGMTGTAREVAGELGAVYGLPVVRVATHRPLRRGSRGERVFRTADAKWDSVVERIAEVHSLGRPILVGTRSVAASELLSARLDEAGLPHCMLNARQDAHEAEVIADAGQRGRITVATNMAGRGTDIRLGAGLGELGGLHVIATERHDARRIDRQLFGRCGRQGDAGSFEMFVSLEDEIFTRYAGPVSRRFGGVHHLQRLAVGAAQRRAQRIHARVRQRLLKFDRDLETTLAFSGPGE
jgi:preprotein translocase subunit SecA